MSTWVLARLKNRKPKLLRRRKSIDLWCRSTGVVVSLSGERKSRKRGDDSSGSCTAECISKGAVFCRRKGRRRDRILLSGTRRTKAPTGKLNAPSPRDIAHWVLSSRTVERVLPPKDIISSCPEIVIRLIKRKYEFRRSPSKMLNLLSRRRLLCIPGDQF